MRLKVFLQQLIYKKRFLADKASSKYNHSPQCQSERIQRFTKKGKKISQGGKYSSYHRKIYSEYLH